MEPSKELERAIESKFLTPQKFAIEIEKIVAQEDLNYIDAILHYCEKNDIEPDSVSRLITKGLKEKIEANARELNFLPKTATLPI